MIELVIGLLSGILTATGLGGGTILILLFSLILNMDQHYAQSTNLIFYIPTALVTNIINLKRGLIEIKSSYIIITFGIMGSIIGAIISTNLNVQILKKVFGIFLICISIYESYNLYNMYIKNKNENNKIYKFKQNDK